MKFRRPDEDVVPWVREFARVYADRGKTGLFEAKRVATLVHPHLYMLAPDEAAVFAATNPHAISTILGEADIDRRGRPPAQDGRYGPGEL